MIGEGDRSERILSGVYSVKGGMRDMEGFVCITNLTKLTFSIRDRR